MTESTARSIFGNKDPVKEAIDIELAEPRNRSYTITGVIHDVENFHIDSDIIISFVSHRKEDDHYPRPSGEKWLNAYNIPDVFLLMSCFLIIMIKQVLKKIYFGSPQKNEKGYCKHGNLKTVESTHGNCRFLTCPSLY